MYNNDNIYSLNTETSYYFDTTFEIIETRTLEDIIIKSENDFNNPNPKIFEIKKEKNKRKKAKTIPFLREIGLTNGKHTKNAKDNIFRRIKVHSFKFIIDFTNDYIKKIFRKRIVKFKKAACNQFVSDVTIGFNHILKKTTLSDILCSLINPHLPSLKALKIFSSPLHKDIKASSDLARAFSNPKV